MGMDVEVIPNQKENADYKGKSVIPGKNGGWRPGAGRKKSITSLISQKASRDVFHSMLSEDNRLQDLIMRLLKWAETDPQVAVYLLNQKIGKAVQAIELSGKDGVPFNIRELSDDELRRQAIAGAEGTS